MKKIIIPIVLVMNILLFTAYAAPLPKVYGYSFQPNGVAYQFFHFGDEYFDEYQLDGKTNGNCAILSELPIGVAYDGFKRLYVPIKGDSRYSNFRYKIDEKDMSEFPKENAEASIMLYLDGQIGDSIYGEDTITINYPENKNTVGLNSKFYITDFGNAKYHVYPARISGCTWGYNFYLITNEYDNLHTTFNKINEISDDKKQDKAYSDFENTVDKLSKEKIDYSKQTYLYFFTGYTAYQWKIKLVKSNTERPITLIPQKAAFDKRIHYSSNIILNLINNKDLAPTTIYINGKEVTDKSKIASDKKYIVVGKEYLNQYESGSKLEVTAKFEDGQTCNSYIDIVDTTSDHYKEVFHDVDSNNEYWEFINELHSRNIINGCSNGQYNPNRKVTQAEFCVMFARALDIQVNSKSNKNWYDSAVQWAESKDYLKNVQPNKEISYKIAAKALLAAVPHDNSLKEIGARELHDSIPIIESNKVETDGTMTRGECAEAILRFSNLIKLIN